MAGQDRQPGIPLAAPRPAHLADGFQRPGGHAVAQAPGPGGQRCGAGHDGHVLPGADARPAGAPESAGPARHSPAAAGDLPQGRFQFQLPARVFVGGRQRRAHHHMVFRAVHMAERHRHHLPDEGDGVGGVGRQAKPEDAVQPLGVAAVADIVTVDAAGLAGLFLVADGALHHRVLFEIFQRRAADQTFFAHGDLLGTGVFYRLYVYYIIGACGMYSWAAGKQLKRKICKLINRISLFELRLLALSLAVPTARTALSPSPNQDTRSEYLYRIVDKS